MPGNGIIDEVSRIVADVLNDRKLALEEHSVARDVLGWDSLTNVQIILAVERHFGIRFTSNELRSWENVGDMCVSIRKRLSADR